MTSPTWTTTSIEQVGGPANLEAGVLSTLFATAPAFPSVIRPSPPLHHHWHRHPPFATIHRSPSTPTTSGGLCRSAALSVWTAEERARPTNPVIRPVIFRLAIIIRTHTVVHTTTHVPCFCMDVSSSSHPLSLTLVRLAWGHSCPLGSSPFVTTGRHTEENLDLVRCARALVRVATPSGGNSKMPEPNLLSSPYNNRA